MICSKQELKEVIAYEKNLYFGEKPLLFYCFGRLAVLKDIRIYDYIRMLRYEEYYFNSNLKNNMIKKVLYLYYKRRKNLLGEKLGFDIPKNCCGKGLRIYHAGVVINSNAKVGDNCRIAGNVCIGGYNGEYPLVGSNCFLGFGSSVVGGQNWGTAVL